MSGLPDAGAGDPLQRRQDLEKTISQLLGEGRMILPGIQAIFGFQMVAVFSAAFASLGRMDRILHLIAIVLVACCMALALAPVAFHRQVEPQGVSEALARYSSRMLTASQALLMIGLCLDVLVVARMSLADGRAPWALAGGLLAVLSTVWFIIPTVVRRRRQRALRRMTRLRELL